jgi:phospholipid/cholesterol/gamma-HCH transport system permease protein
LKIFFHIGRYFLFLGKIFHKPEKSSIYFKQFIKEIEKIGINSIGIVLIISVFMGAVITLQTAYNFTSPIIPRYLIGLGARDSMLLEFSSSMLSLILAGKVGSNIASEIGTMRITEQIDALEIMGVNSAGYLILPKIIASLFFFPLLCMMSMVIGVFGGFLASVFTDAVTTDDFVMGIHAYFVPFYIVYSLVKMLIFAFVISSVSSYHGYHVKGGALDVGKSSTQAVVYASILILLFNVLLTQLMLA